MDGPDEEEGDKNKRPRMVLSEALPFPRLDQGGEGAWSVGVAKDIDCQKKTSTIFQWICKTGDKTDIDCIGN